MHHVLLHVVRFWCFHLILFRKAGALRWGLFGASWKTDVIITRVSFKSAIQSDWASFMNTLRTLNHRNGASWFFQGLRWGWSVVKNHCCWKMEKAKGGWTVVQLDVSIPVSRVKRSLVSQLLLTAYTMGGASVWGCFFLRVQGVYETSRPGCPNLCDSRHLSLWR